MKLILAIALALMLFSPCWAQPVGPKPTPALRTVAEMVTEGRRLRNTDPEITREDEWRRVLSALAAVPRGAEGVVSARRMAIELHETIFRRNDQRRDARAAIRTYESVLDEPLTPEERREFLLKYARFLGELGESDEAEEVLRTLISEAPQSDEGIVAQVLLSGDAVPATAIPTRRRRDLPIVVIDPGHGGDDFGAIGFGGLREKDLTLAVARMVVETLEKQGRVQPVLTRSNDRFVPLAERIAFANEQRAAAFVSLHANASMKRTARGFELFVLGEAEDDVAVLLAARENGSDHDKVSDLALIVGGLIQDAKTPLSERLGGLILSHSMTRIRRLWPDVKDRGVRRGPFYLLVGAHMPSVLVEMGFIDHPDDGEQLSRPEVQGAFARGLSQALEEFVLSEQGR